MRPEKKTPRGKTPASAIKKSSARPVKKLPHAPRALRKSSTPSSERSLSRPREITATPTGRINTKSLRIDPASPMDIGNTPKRGCRLARTNNNSRSATPESMTPKRGRKQTASGMKAVERLLQASKRKSSRSSKKAVRRITRSEQSHDLVAFMKKMDIGGNKAKEQKP
ncbi:unnamed protein product, partial [Mesorhabditis spiculigera]